MLASILYATEEVRLAIQLENHEVRSSKDKIKACGSVSKKVSRIDFIAPSGMFDGTGLLSARQSHFSGGSCLADIDIERSPRL